MEKVDQTDLTHNDFETAYKVPRKRRQFNKEGRFTTPLSSYDLKQSILEKEAKFAKESATFQLPSQSKFKPWRRNQNGSAIVAEPKDYYDNKEQFSKIARDQLQTANLRKFHNWIKSCLIDKYASIVKSSLKNDLDAASDHNLLNVLDIGIGQGGDILKWKHASIGWLFGIDPSGQSLMEAHRRYRSAQCRFGVTLIEGQGNASEKIFENYFNQNADDNKETIKNVYFDIISSQFCCHYMFDSEQSVRRLLSNITSRLLWNGYVILTIPDANVIVKKLRAQGINDENGEYIYKRKSFSIKFRNLDFPADKVYGLKYLFSLEDAVGQTQTGQEIYVAEYLIEQQNFVKIALEYGLIAVENLNFIEFYKKYREQYAEMLAKQRFAFQPGESLSDDLWNLSHCYRAMVFIKANGVDPIEVKKYRNMRQFRFRELTLQSNISERQRDEAMQQ